MAKVFRADKSFVNYIQMIGFQRKHIERECSYYVNHRGNQIVIESNYGQIRFVNKYGYTIDKAHSFTSRQIDAFSKRYDK